MKWQQYTLAAFRAIAAAKKYAIVGILVWLLIVVAVKLFVDSKETHVTQIKETITERPHDCDFWKAPIGSKECHYEKHVIGYFDKNGNSVHEYDPAVVEKVYVWQKVED